MFKKVFSFSDCRFGLVTLFFFIFCVCAFLTRAVLAFYSWDDISHAIPDLLLIFFIGMSFDLVVAGCFAVPLAIYFALVPSRFLLSKAHRIATYSIFGASIYLFLFGGVSEYIFWDEFGVRFNFIAVDYLVYSQEVLGNIWESYPVPSVLTLLSVIAFLIFRFLKPRIQEALSQRITFLNRLKYALFTLLFTFPILMLSINIDFPGLSNTYENGLSQNGIYQLFSAFFNNELDYPSFYRTMDNEEALRLTEKLDPLQGSSMELNLDRFSKIVTGAGAEKKYNVVLVMSESMSSQYLGVMGDGRNMTPNIDSIAKDGLLFSGLYATGTRTVRGMEAVTLSIPPTPGRSIVKRPHNSNLFSLGFLFRDKGYTTQFLYGGYGYFDNMNDFFSHNGFATVDRSDFKKKEITFSNIWGVSDEDLFNRSIKEFDNSYLAKKPFMGFIMTTSNHRPYTYPEGKIDIPSHTGRSGGVKYADYALGEFIREARKHEWFDNTLFVIVADHCASSAGRTEIPIHNYHIPLILYGPKFIKPGINNTIASQIDVGPTILGLLGWSYESKFLGSDILREGFKPRAFVGNYQKLGYLKEKILTVLSPRQKVSQYKITREENYFSEMVPIAPDLIFIKETIGYYQSAAYLYKNDLTQWHPHDRDFAISYTVELPHSNSQLTVDATAIN